MNLLGLKPTGDDATIHEGVKEVLSAGAEHMSEFMGEQVVREKARNEQRVMEALAKDLVLPLLLYLCSANADLSSPIRIKQKVKSPAGKKRKIVNGVMSGGKLYEVGYRIGAAIERARKKTGYVAEDEESEPTGRKMPGHVRRSHFHHFWTGKRSEPASRRLIVKWLSPVLVNLDLTEDIEKRVGVVHPVRG